MKHIFISAALVALITPPAEAQTVVQAKASSLTPQISRDSGGFSQCGAHLVVLDDVPNGMDAYDFSINVYAKPFMGAIKAGKLHVTKEEMKKPSYSGTTVLPAPIKFWIAKESDEKQLAPEKYIPADSPGYVMAGANGFMSFSTLINIISGERMQVAVRYKSEPLDRVLSFAATPSKDEVAALMACVSGVYKRLKAEVKSDPSEE